MKNCLIQELTVVLFDCRYPYSNFLHHHVENIIFSCLESKNASLSANLLQECNLLDKILEAEKNFMLPADPNKVISSPFVFFFDVHKSLLLNYLLVLYFCKTFEICV